MEQLNITTSLSEQLRQLLQTKFKFKAFRAGQLEAVTTLLNHGRLLCIKPTGHGKSLLYQLPAVLLPGITLVISPLLALMRDQLNQLNQRFSIPAASINSDQSDQENYNARRLVTMGKIKILFIAPEKLDQLNYFNFFLNLNINLVVIDEAHCISTWGHDFRPSYRKIIHFIRAVEQKNPQLKVLALTATANQKTEVDIKNQLTNEKQSVQIQRHSMSRSNIKLNIIQCAGFAEKLSVVLQLLNQVEGHGLIYCATRENTELLAEYLQTLKINAAAYHAGLPADTKRQLQQNFIQNKYKVIAATNALGMGIDKQDLRFIIHFDMPGSITAYYQEVGRCGRDSQPAQGILLFDEADKKIQDYFINASQPCAEDFDHVLHYLKTAKTTANLAAIKQAAGFHPNRVQLVISELLEQGFVIKDLQFSKQIYKITAKTGIPDLSRYQNQFQVRMSELKQMLYYGQQNNHCLMQLLCQALGDSSANRCLHCNICSKQTFLIKHSNAGISKIQNWLNLRKST